MPHIEKTTITTHNIEKTTTTTHSIFHYPVGDQIFICPAVGKDFAKFIGFETSLAKITEVILIEGNCYVCNGNSYEVHYKVKIIDSNETDFVGVEVVIDPKNVNASKRQSLASYFGQWNLYREVKVEEPLTLVKTILWPNYFGFEEYEDFIHIIYPNAYSSRIVNKNQLNPGDVEKIKQHFQQIINVDYCSIYIEQGDYTTKGYTFKFLDETLNFQA
jgi:hypothetical protein